MNVEGTGPKSLIQKCEIVAFCILVECRNVLAKAAKRNGSEIN